MKSLFLFALVAFAIGCSKNAGTDEPQTPDQPSEQPEMVTVSFAVKGDITINEEPLPLSRAAGVETESTDLYGINIYYDKDKDGKINDVYGYGLFDNVADMTVSLLTGYKYKFICSLVKDGKNKILNAKATKSSSYSSYAGYGAPFWKSSQSYNENTSSYSSYYSSYSSSYYYNYDYDYHYYDAPTILTNQFTLGTSFHLTGLGQGWGHNKNNAYTNDKYIYCSGSGLTHYFPADRYYGETTNYTPKEGGIVAINMKRCTFGAKFVVTGVTDGAFSFSVQSNNVKVTSGGNIKSDTTYTEQIYTYDNVYDCWQKTIMNGDFSQDFTITMTWVRGNGITQTLDPLTVTFKRNVLTTVNIRLNGGDVNNSFNLDVENTEMGEANTNFDIDAGSMTDTPVEPTE